MSLVTSSPTKWKGLPDVNRIGVKSVARFNCKKTADAASYITDNS